MLVLRRSLHERDARDTCSHFLVHQSPLLFFDLISDNVNGLVVVHARERPVQDVFEFEDFCSLTCIRCEYEHHEFPKYFVFEQEGNDLLSCSKVKPRTMQFRTVSPCTTLNNKFIAKGNFV